MIITSKDNENVKLFKKIASDRKFRAQNGLFALEGFRLIADSAVPFHSVFYTGKYAESIKDIKSERYFEISETVAEKISDTKSPQGVFALAKIPEREIKAQGKLVVLCGLSDPGNIGTIIRTADALGVSGIFAADCADIYSPKTTRAAMGALLRANIEVCGIQNVFEKLADCEKYAAVARSGAAKLGSFPFPENAAVFIGNEANGLPDEIVKNCKSITIPMGGNAESLNAAAAASILIYELTK
ncbi:MAG: RNA methyltransferase [Ruminococcus sp.]|jgi:TrmH family RNA methyltransferase|nr:RNA methyltransferase [Ruminococcus sp.]